MCALLERAGGMRADHPAIKEKLPAQEVCLPAQCALKSHVQSKSCVGYQKMLAKATCIKMPIQTASYFHFSML